MKPEHIELIERLLNLAIDDDDDNSFVDIHSGEHVMGVNMMEKLIAAIEVEKDNEISALNNFNAMQGKALKNKQTLLEEARTKNALIEREANATLTDRIAELECELEIERCRLAACGVAALGYFEGCAENYKSASLDDVLRMRGKLDELERENERLQHELGRAERENIRLMTGC